MSNNDKNALKNAAEIIERFGGIRPMAAKIDTPVTTVQGWKKRDVIPGARRQQILSAATENDIDLSDLVNASSTANQNKESEITQAKNKASVSTPSTTPITSSNAPIAQELRNEKVKTETVLTPPNSSSKAAHDNILKAIEENNKKTMAASAWITTGLILLAAGVGTFLLWPSMKENNAQLDAQSEKIVALENEVQDVSKSTSFIKEFVPENIQQKMDKLQIQAQNIQNTVQQLSEQASDITSGVFSSDAGPLSERLMILEEKMAELSGNDNNFGDLISRIRNLEDSVPGQEQLKSSVEELRAMVQNQGTGDALSDGLADAQNDEEGALSQTLEGVSGNDLKAAAMLIAFSQLRDSLNREEPFENDLLLLEKLAGEDNPELQTALDRLAPHADGGVLTAKGLSGELKGLTGDIVVASLKGEDISFKEKAKARLGNILQVEKEGELVTGTETQIKVSKAQKMLDEGNIQGAIAELQTLEGEAAQTAQPFIQQAQISLLAEKVQQMLGEDILSKISGQIPGAGNLLKGLGAEAQNMNSNAFDNVQQNPQLGPIDPAQAAIQGISPDQYDQFNMNEIKKKLENAVPEMGSQEVIRDEESGVTILPSQPGFKGFSGGK